jgi:hypothetical protein
MSMRRFPEPHLRGEPKKVSEPFGTLSQSWPEVAGRGLGHGSRNRWEPSAAQRFPVSLPLKEGTGTRARFAGVPK